MCNCAELDRGITEAKDSFFDSLSGVGGATLSGLSGAGDRGGVSVLSILGECCNCCGTLESDKSMTGTDASYEGTLGLTTMRGLGTALVGGAPKLLVWDPEPLTPQLEDRGIISGFGAFVPVLINVYLYKDLFL